MKRTAGFTLIEAALTGAVLMIGVIALIHISRTSMGQISDIRNTQGQPAFAESLIRDQIEAIMAAPGPGAFPQVAPLLVDGNEYRVVAVADGTEQGMNRYRITVTFRGQPFKAGGVDAGAVYVWRY
ncbi:MAG: hypothetical protein FJZ01_23370 [Candidatus Sericytochromatia bacterium]|nr:hypothetical protein [Candidatus Tanganyikabacteria bacterium]